MNSANFAFFALLLLLGANGTITSTQALLIAALLTTGNCGCNDNAIGQNLNDISNLNNLNNIGGTVAT